MLLRVLSRRGNKIFLQKIKLGMNYRLILRPLHPLTIFV